MVHLEGPLQAYVYENLSVQIGSIGEGSAWRVKLSLVRPSAAGHDVMSSRKDTVSGGRWVGRGVIRMIRVVPSLTGWKQIES